MIARSIDRKKKTHKYRFLALYVANARIKSGKGGGKLYSVGTQAVTEKTIKKA